MCVEKSRANGVRFFLRLGNRNFYRPSKTELYSADSEAVVEKVPIIS